MEYHRQPTIQAASDTANITFFRDFVASGGTNGFTWFMIRPGDLNMMQKHARKSLAIAPLIVLLLASDPAHALRCGSKLVKDGMHRVEVIALCGEPVSTQSLGYVLRYYDPLDERRGLSSYGRYYGYGVRQELLVTVLLFNFGPHKLMRTLRFEGGRLTSIKTEGYGFRQ